MAFGFLPLMLRCSPSKMRLLTTFGVGVLVGTALIVIIPEGIHTIYSPPPDDADYVPVDGAAGHDHGDGHGHDHACLVETDASKHIGAALAAGFIFQLLVDNLSSGGGEGGHGHSHGGAPPPKQPQQQQQQRRKKRAAGGGADGAASGGESTPLMAAAERGGSSGDVSLPVLAAGDERGGAGAGGGEGVEEAGAAAGSSDAHAATLGLLVHAAVDGVALGAVSFTGDTSVEAVVFLAIILHKAPAAFGITSYLLHARRSRAEVAMRLLAFSAAPVVTALLTFAVLGEGLLEPATTQEWMGLCLLFSAGSFVYVATVHVLPEVRGTEKLSAPYLASLVAGIALPLLISGDHDHGH